MRQKWIWMFNRLFHFWLMMGIVWMMPQQTFGQETAGDSAAKEFGQEMIDGFSVEEFDVGEIQDFLNSIGDEQEIALSFRELMEDLVQGKVGDVFLKLAQTIGTEFFSELRTNAGLLGQIIILALTGAVFSGFSGIFASGHVSETGFYVVYLLAMAFLASSFFASVQIAGEVTQRIVGFMQVLMPSWLMAVAMAGGALTSAAICGFVFGAIGFVQTAYAQLLLPLTRIHLMLILAGNLYKEDMFSRFTELLEHGIMWAVKAMFGVIVGFHIIQGLILPQADAVKNASALRLIQMIPGVGIGTGAFSQLLMGSGVLIKNTAGVAAVAVLCFMAAVPMLKLFLLMILYYVAAAVMQPVCDKRLVSCMMGTAVGHGLLLRMVGYSLALFAATIAVICISTNAAWYAG